MPCLRGVSCSPVAAHQHQTLFSFSFPTITLWRIDLWRHFSLEMVECLIENVILSLHTVVASPSVKASDVILSTTLMRHVFRWPRNSQTHDLVNGAYWQLQKRSPYPLYQNYLLFYLIGIDGVTVKPSSAVCNLVVLFDPSLSSEPHIWSLILSSFSPNL